MNVRRSTAALLIALVVPLPSGGIAHADEALPVRLVPAKLPYAGHPTVAWVDPGAQVIHDGDRRIALTPRLAGTRLTEVRRAGASYVARDSAGAVYRVAVDGTHAPLVEASDDPVAVDDTGLTLAVAVSDPTTGLPYLEAVRISDGVVLDRVQTDLRDIFDFTGGVVTFESQQRRGQTFTSRLSTWDTRGQSIDVGGKRLADPAYVDVDAGLASRQVHGDFEGVVVQSIRRRAAVKPWRAELSTLESISPNGRWVVTYRLSGQDSSFAPGTLTIRDARTGVVKRSVRLVLHGVSGWESNRRVVVNAYQRSKDGDALVRLDVASGKAERISGYSRNDVDRLFAQ